MRSKALINVLNLAVADEMPVEQAFLSDLNRSIELADAEGRRVASQTYKPSSLHCIRNMYFQIKGVEPTTTPSPANLIGICESGTDRHNRIQLAVESMKEHGIDCEYCDVAEYVREYGLESKLEIKSKQGNETKLYHKELNISFLCDGIIKYKGKHYILEIKTETSNKFWTQKDVMPEHILQGTAYSLCFDISDVIFLYENRDNCSKKTFLLHVTDDMRTDLAQRLKLCDSYAENDTVPPKPAESKSCNYCAYKEECKKYD